MINNAAPNFSLLKPAPPKRPLAPYFLFKQDVYDQVKKENPESKITELTQIIASRWKLVPPEQKTKYEVLHEESKKRYEREKKDYDEKYGKPENKHNKEKYEKIEKKDYEEFYDKPEKNDNQEKYGKPEKRNY